jgi:hypothetical protein
MAKHNTFFSSTIPTVFIVALLLLAAGGWGWNIAKIFQADTISGMVVARVVGVVIPPVGAIMGYL